MLNNPISPRKLIHRMAPLAALLLLSANLYAEQPMALSLSGSTEVPAVSSSAKGSGQISILPDRSVTGSIKVSGFVPTVAHIHEAAVGKNGPPIITLSKMGSDGFVVPPDAKLSEAQYKSYMAGGLYVNVHSAQYPDGEIRAQLTSVAGPMRSGY